MKRTLMVISAVLATAVAASAQVKIPFDVPLPTWKMLVTAKHEDNPPIVNRKPNASSENLVRYCGGEDCSYRWMAPSMFLKDGEEKVTIGTYDVIPVKSQGNGWVNIEYVTDEGDFSGWSPAYGLRSVETFKLTKSDIAESVSMIAWEAGGELYVVFDGGGVPGYNTFYVGKLKDGYVVCPFYCVLEIDYGSKHPGILNGFLGDNPDGLSKFTYRDVEYILGHAQKSNTCPFVVFGYKNTEGEKQEGSVCTYMVSNRNDGQEIKPSEDNAVYTEVETPATYAGGLAAMFTQIARNQRYPLAAQEMGVQGKVIVSFVIEKDGRIGETKVVKSVDPDLDREAVRVVKTLSGFSPGKIGGKVVRTKMSIPITFKLK
ncbi:energy transducer TonB [Xylanibacter muris]|uniref:Energy transducer TonB n=1 Tax=Xylanibacter muris TaxID=2736290 RepID=A0ABX2AL16_9BACT|nr:energy transducer TonB [Xylanibacter muris]NPD91470.1 energy transducer TonB [Xylanibacter muris]